MRILTDPSRESLYHFEYQKEILRVFFLLNQVDLIDKDSLLYQNLSSYEMIPLPVLQEEEILNRTQDLIKNLKVVIDPRVKVFRNYKNFRYFLIAKDKKFLEVDTEIYGITDRTYSLFWQNHYNFKKPESKPFSEIKIYKEILHRMDQLVNSFVSK